MSQRPSSTDRDLRPRSRPIPGTSDSRQRLPMDSSISSTTSSRTSARATYSDRGTRSDLVAAYRAHSDETFDTRGSTQTSANYGLDRLQVKSNRQVDRRRKRTRLTRRAKKLIVVVLVSIFVLVVGTGRVSGPPAVADIHAVLPSSFKVAGTPPALPWPKTGQAAVSIPLLGLNVQSGPQTPVPIASLTKMMTAYIILHDRPLKLGQSGPGITMGPVDLNYFNTDALQGQANVQVSVGEVLSERQALDGLLVHSADNLAETLARWDSGSISAFVAKMNRTAAELGMNSTHYADPSGFSPQSTSTASDVLKIASLDMENPVFAQIVRMPSVTLPVVGTVSSYTPLLGVDGIVGVKSGFTTAAGGCDVVAVPHQVDGRTFLVLAAVTGQQGPVVLPRTAVLAFNLTQAAAGGVTLVSTLHIGKIAGIVSAAGYHVDAAITSNESLLAWPGQTIRYSLLRVSGRRDGIKAGALVAIAYSYLGNQQNSSSVLTVTRLRTPSLIQRLL